MKPTARVFLGLGVLMVVVLFPFWWFWGFDRTTAVPVIPKPASATECVADVGYMRSSHMELLDRWRDKVVRDGQRYATDEAGQKLPYPAGHPHAGDAMELSLTNTCLGCHGTKDEFCIACHVYVGVSAYCWDCHLDTKGAN